MAITRRQFIWRSLGALGAATLGFERFGLVQALDRGATRIARGILAWSARHAAPSRRGWIVAMRSLQSPARVSP